MLDLSPGQDSIVRSSSEGSTFLEGVFGTGKTTAGIFHILHLIESGIRPDTILVLIPQRSLASPYYKSLLRSDITSPSEIDILTMYGLARRMIDLYWPLISEEAGFSRPEDPPTFLTIETAQYFMAKLVSPLLEQGYFDGITASPNRLYSQILDDLNKSAVVGFPYTDFGERLNRAWLGDQTQRHAYAQAQECANIFRQYCLENNLLDFSLQMEIFAKHLWDVPIFQEHLEEQYQHLIFDNLEEDAPVIHDLLIDWLPSLLSALLIYDTDGGYRTFLGADPVSATRLKQRCNEVFLFSESFVTSPDMQAFGSELASALGAPSESIQGNSMAVITHNTERYFPELLDWVAVEVSDLVKNQGVSPSEIAILSPFIPDVLRFQLQSRFEALGIPYHTHRPSRALREEPAIRTLLTLAKIVHPDWGMKPNSFDISYAFLHSIEGLDLIRAQLLTDEILSKAEAPETLVPFERLDAVVQERVTYVVGERYENFRKWLAQYTGGPPLEFDHFLARLFGEVLSQPGYGFHDDIDAGGATARLIESVQKFRWIVKSLLLKKWEALGQEFVEMVDQGVIAALYMQDWGAPQPDAVLISPAFTFLMSNHPLEYQFWLNVGSHDWWRRIYQPLTHPYVLSRNWAGDRHWEDADEVAANREVLYRLTQGLVRRCKERIYLGFNDIGPYGFEERGPLLRAVHRLLRSHAEFADV